MDLMGRINLWKEVMMHPDATLAAEVAKKEGSIPQGVVNLLLAYLVFIIPATLLSVLLGLGAGIVGIIGALASVAIFVAMALAGSFVVAGLYYIMAHVLGGKAPYGKLYYLVSLVMAPAIVLQLVGIIPLLGTLVSLVVGIYALWLLTQLFEKLYKFSLMKAIAVWLVPLIVMVIVMFVLATVVFVGMLGALGAAAGAAGSAGGYPGY